MPDDRFNSVKMNITRSRNHDYNTTDKMSFKRMSGIFTKSAAHLHNMTYELANN